MTPLPHAAATPIDTTIRAIKLFGFNPAVTQPHTEPCGCREPTSIYPFAKLRVGDCFITTRDKSESVRMTRHRFHAKTEKRFVGEMTKDGVCVWRVE